MSSRAGFTFRSPFALAAFVLVCSGLATGIGTIAAVLLNACSAGACP